MKRVTSSQYLILEKRNLSQRRQELDGILKYDWGYLKYNQRPKTLAGMLLLKVLENSQQVLHYDFALNYLGSSQGVCRDSRKEKFAYLN